MRRDDETRPRPESGPATNITNHGPLTIQDAPLENLLARLDRVRKSPKGWTAKCPGPNHARGDRWPSLSIAVGDDDRVLLHCFVGCTADQITRALGIELRDLFRRRDDRRPWRPGPRARPVTMPRSVARGLVKSDAFAKEWTIAKALAELEPRQQRADVVASWDYLTERVDIPAIMQLASVLRGVALHRYCDRTNAADPEAVARAVRRLIEDIERSAA